MPDITQAIYSLFLSNNFSSRLSFFYFTKLLACYLPAISFYYIMLDSKGTI